jgi:hypothetical protein
MDGGRVIVGAPTDENDFGEFNSGSAYVFRREGTVWTQEAKINAGDHAPGDQFGIAVSISGDLLVVGAHLNDGAGNDAGAAYVFQRQDGSWVQEAKLTAMDGLAEDWFGQSVSISGRRIVVGAQRSDERASEAGAAYVFLRQDDGTWTQFHCGQTMCEIMKLTAYDPEQMQERFGWSVTIGPGRVVASAAADDSWTGSAYVFGGVSDCDANGVLDAYDLAAGTTVDADGNGIPDSCECPADLNGDGSVATADLLDLLSQWGTDPGGPPDFDGNGSVGTSDLLKLLSDWGACP